MRLIGRQMTELDVAVGSDRVVCSYPIPAGGRLNSTHLEMHMIGDEGQVLDKAVMYGMTGFVVPVIDPETAINVDTLWDNVVPKDVAEGAGVFDLDTDATDTTPEFEPGEPDWSGVFKLNALDVQEIFRRRRLITLASQNGAGHEIVAAGADLWTPLEFFKTMVKKKVSVQSPSMVLYGVSSPSMDVTTTAVNTAPTETQWVLLQYLELTLEQAFMNLIGLVETGAETPFEDSSVFIARLIEGAIREEDAAAFTTTVWRCFCRATFDITVPGTVAPTVLTSE